MKGLIIKDWSKVNMQRRGDQIKVVHALTHFCRKLDSTQFKGALQHLATKGDFPAEILQVLEKFHATPDWDTAFEEIFDIRDFSGTRAGGFSILDVDDGLTFAKVTPGDKAQIYKFSGTKTDVTFDLYGGGLSWFRTLIDDGEYWTLEDNAIAFRNAAYSSRAQDFYDLIDALGSGDNVAWQAVTGSIPSTSDVYVMNRDANTINKACETILVDLKDKGMGITASTPFILLAPIQLKQRMNAALKYLTQPVGGSEPQVQYSITPRYTLMLASSTVYYVCIPKRKAKGGYRMPLTVFGRFDDESYSDIAVGWQRYGGAIGEVDQFKRCATS